MDFEELIGYNFYEMILLITFTVSFVIQMVYIFSFYFRLLFLKDPEHTILETPISILVTVRNEEERIYNLLDQLLTINYDSYEVVVVDDFSEDRTLQILGSLSRLYPKLRFTSINQDNRYSQKLSINLGLKACETDWIMYLPTSAKIETETLFNLNNFIAEDMEVVIGYSNYISNQGFTNGLNRIERFVGFIRSSAYSLSGYPLIFSQNNLAFKKGLYFESDGFRGKLQQYFADLELILNDKFKRVGISCAPFGRVVEKERTEMQDYINLIKKEIYIRRTCNRKKRLLLLIEDFSNVIFLFSFILLLMFKINFGLYVALMFLIPNVFMFFIVKKIIVRLNEAKIFLSSFLYLLIKPLINIYHATGMYIQDRRNKWN